MNTEKRLSSAVLTMMLASALAASSCAPAAPDDEMWDEGPPGG